MIEFKKFIDFPRGTMYDILLDAYSFDPRNKVLWDENWRESDKFFYDNPEIADKYGLVTCLDGEPIGFVTWDPRHRPEYVEVGHNGIREKFKRMGYGHMQLEEAVKRIKEYEGLDRIIVCTNANLVALKNYESVGFKLYDRKTNKTESAYTGDYLYYELKLFPIRSFKAGDEVDVSDVICHTLQVCNAKDYSQEFIKKNFEEHSPDVIAKWAEDAHFYVATDGGKIVGCGGITGYWGSTTESYLLSIFVLPEYQGRGIGKRIVAALEVDEYFKRAWRTEVGSSLTTVDFYRKLGYEFKSGVTAPDGYGVVRLEKRRKKHLSEMSLKELWQLFPIVLTEHQACWEGWYNEEAGELKKILHSDARIHHVGSTAIRGIWARPIIDILIEIPKDAELRGIKDLLLTHGYLCMSESEERISLNKGYTENGFAEKVFHLHVRYEGDNDELYFRDYLSERPAVAEEYERLKLKLWKAFEHDRDGYTAAKTEFVKKWTAEARKSS